ncbi:MAG: hypothetical protein WDW38_009092 [Sanguina aurantia]
MHSELQEQDLPGGLGGKGSSSPDMRGMERQLWGEGYRRVGGVDEVGRGPLAGPVVAAVCIIPQDVHIPGVNDSKKLNEKTRERLYSELTTHPRIAWAVYALDHTEVDDLNILNATLNAMSRAVAKLSGAYPTASSNSHPSPEAHVNTTAHSRHQGDISLTPTQAHHPHHQHQHHQHPAGTSSTLPQQQQQQQQQQQIGPHSTLSKQHHPPEQQQQQQQQAAHPSGVISKGGLQSAGIQPLQVLHAGANTASDTTKQLLQSAGVDFLLVDGNKIPSGLPSGVGSRFVIKGDSQCYCIAAASIIAKVTRDRMMLLYDAQHPLYGFAKHKGYGVASHMAAIRAHGPCVIHRRSFEPTKSMEGWAHPDAALRARKASGAPRKRQPAVTPAPTAAAAAAAAAPSPASLPPPPTGAAPPPGPRMPLPLLP